MNQEYRLYTFVNFYLSSIQQGIQSAHVTHSLFVKYKDAEIGTVTYNSEDILWDWAKNDKTMIVLNGGAGPDIKSAFETISSLNITHNGAILPIECFYEDASLDGMMTSFGIVVPPCYYDAIPSAKAVWDAPFGGTWKGPEGAFVYDQKNFPPGQARVIYMPGTSEHLFISIMKSCGLAR